mmetsp:Transcript_5122/g.17841  ORF Transcript_5122/g.17841 Transcript_5122/m.17841 type:complete len:489 (-) Transcript_5122:1333-2799(-)
MPGRRIADRVFDSLYVCACVYNRKINFACVFGRVRRRVHAIPGLRMTPSLGSVVVADDNAEVVLFRVDEALREHGFVLRHVLHRLPLLPVHLLVRLAGFVGVPDLAENLEVALLLAALEERLPEEGVVFRDDDVDLVVLERPPALGRFAAAEEGPVEDAAMPREADGEAGGGDVDFALVPFRPERDFDDGVHILVRLAPRDFVANVRVEPRLAEVALRGVGGAVVLDAEPVLVKLRLCRLFSLALALARLLLLLLVHSFLALFDGFRRLFALLLELLLPHNLALEVLLLKLFVVVVHLGEPKLLALGALALRLLIRRLARRLRSRLGRRLGLLLLRLLRELPPRLFPATEKALFDDPLALLLLVPRFGLRGRRDGESHRVPRQRLHLVRARRLFGRRRRRLFCSRGGEGKGGARLFRRCSSCSRGFAVWSGGCGDASSCARFGFRRRLLLEGRWRRRRGWLEAPLRRFHRLRNLGRLGGGARGVTLAA